MPFPFDQPPLDVNPQGLQQGELLSALQRSPELDLRKQFAKNQFPSWAMRAFAPGGFGSQAPPATPPSAAATSGLILPGPGGGSVHYMPTVDEHGQSKVIGMPSPTPAPAGMDFGMLGTLSPLDVERHLTAQMNQPRVGV